MHGDFDLSELGRVAPQTLAPVLLFLLEPRRHGGERLRHGADRRSILRGHRTITSHFSEYNQLQEFCQLETGKCFALPFTSVNVPIVSSRETIRTKRCIGS
jgi:hypothetical protein